MVKSDVTPAPYNSLRTKVEAALSGDFATHCELRNVALDVAHVWRCFIQIVVVGRHLVRPFEPTVEIDEPAAVGAERVRRLVPGSGRCPRRPLADRASAGRWRALVIDVHVHALPSLLAGFASVLAGLASTDLAGDAEDSLSATALVSGFLSAFSPVSGFFSPESFLASLA